MTADQVMHVAGALAVGLFTAGVAWGAVKGSIRVVHTEIKGVDARLELHMKTTATWRDELGQRVGSIETHLRGPGG